jgi:hypothetical protein
MNRDDLPAGCTPPTVTTAQASRLRYVSSCGCGWRSKPCLNAAFANQEWDTHVGRRVRGA